ncbi:SMI1/KNR4 family protein [Ktedonobacter sp. SOSP1-85]|uniref:SMI1/KNR4 family protein n=1 Tax=Ktedonobacter sp. SOSP1-85 TaxID=2778367 RepID=UPI001915975E|nr:SMI1/KNR4 family protein [Ktedonobacter sp. SOSP1-85]GHO79377.1 SMI1/KNR4 family protein [Ktedonobacter sp. SOSP1-85]
MLSIQELVEKIRITPDCFVATPCGLPQISKEHQCPDDVREFYEICGGVSLFVNAEVYRVSIVPPAEVILANPVIVGSRNYSEEALKDISWSWYTIAKDDNNEYLTIDFSKQRLGRCYNSFFDVHAVAGSCPIIARSFTELLNYLYEGQGDDPYWELPDFVSLGDAYDNVQN